MDAPIAEPRPSGSVSSNVVEQSWHQSPSRDVAVARTVEAKRAARSALAHLELAPQEADGLAVRRRLYHFFETTAFKA
jgi:hypothetical protein